MAFAPLEIVQQCPGVERANLRSVGDRASEFGKYLPVPCYTPEIWYPTAILLVGCVEITASAFGDFDWQAVIFSRNVRYEVINAARPDLEPSLCERSFFRHLGVEPGVGIATTGAPGSISVPLKLPPPKCCSWLASETTRRV